MAKRREVVGALVAKPGRAAMQARARAPARGRCCVRPAGPMDVDRATPDASRDLVSTGGTTRLVIDIGLAMPEELLRRPDELIE